MSKLLALLALTGCSSGSGLVGPTVLIDSEGELVGAVLGIGSVPAEAGAGAVGEGEDEAKVVSSGMVFTVNLWTGFVFGRENWLEFRGEEGCGTRFIGGAGISTGGDNQVLQVYSRPSGGGSRGKTIAEELLVRGSRREVLTWADTSCNGESEEGEVRVVYELIPAEIKLRYVTPLHLE